MKTSEKIVENRCRRVLARRGLLLRKRDPEALGYGGYMIFDSGHHFRIVEGGAHGGFSMTLTEVEGFIEGNRLGLRTGVI